MQEQGKDYETYIKGHERFETDAEYEAGWLAGEAEGIKLQQQAVAVGSAAAGAYGANSIKKEMDKNDPDKIAKDAVKGVDADALKSLEN
ncbi:hypothetical protein BST95_14905 [Halioglobus japonicus]|nr:hypothetical protein [Halioglobus japonicus]AQA19338.1 hypothetical protein BST95_14905 [Halioglobus japonicus]GHD07524.1 hypothetical protein GCM10007052_03420 [Halioglobus japonicus]